MRGLRRQETDTSHEQDTDKISQSEQLQVVARSGHMLGRRGKAADGCRDQQLQMALTDPSTAAELLDNFS